MIHDNSLPFINCVHSEEEKGFVIEQDENDGSIYVANLVFFDNNATPIYFFHPLNCKENWSLQMLYKNETYWVFDKEGNFMPDAKSLFKQ